MRTDNDTYEALMRQGITRQQIDALVRAWGRILVEVLHPRLRYTWMSEEVRARQFDGMTPG